MANNWTSTRAGRHLTRRRKVNTAPEIMLRKALHSLGVRFRIHRNIARGCTPDIVLPRHGIAIFVDGDYWHSCPVHRADKQFRGPNAALWEAKMVRNQERDRRSTTIAQDAGWRVVRVWECAVHDNPRGVAREVLSGRTPPPAPRISL